MKTKPYDEHYRRRHRIVGHYLVIQAWLRGLDCIVLNRRDIQAFLSITDIHKDRIKQFVADIAPWFSFHKPCYDKGSGTLSFLFLSGVDIDSYLPSGPMPVDQRIAKVVAANGMLKIERFSKVDSHAIPSEEKNGFRPSFISYGIKDALK